MFQGYVRRIVMIFASLFGASTASAAVEHTKDSIETVKTNLKEKKAVILDVRENDEWEAGHLKNAAHYPLSKMQNGISAEELAKIAPHKEIIYVHCASGFRCLKAARLMSEKGYDVRALQSGYKDLSQAGFPTAK